MRQVILVPDMSAAMARSDIGVFKSVKSSLPSAVDGKEELLQVRGVTEQAILTLKPLHN